MFDNNFGNCWQIFEIFRNWFARKFCMYYKDIHLTCNILLHYLVKFENPKLLPNFYVEYDNILTKIIMRFYVACYKILH